MQMLRSVFVVSLALWCVCTACMAADQLPDSGALPQLRQQGAFFASLLRNVYSLAGIEGVRGDGVYFVPEQPDCAPILLVGAASAGAEVSVAATLQQAYPLGAGGRRPEQGVNPGRRRSVPLLKALYGKNAFAVRSSCERVDFFGQKVLFNTRHGAAAALKRVVARLEEYIAAHPDERVYLLPPGGTFAWRQVKDTGQLSAHAFGIAIDLSTGKAPYWLWRPAAATVTAARERYPQGIVDAFEAEGFIWGGKWDAYDFMHFEYRPEFRAYTGYAGGR